MGLNVCILSGYLANDVSYDEYDTTNRAKFTVAVSRPGSKDKEGNRKQLTDFIRVIAWGKNADVANNYLKKGSGIEIYGRLSVNSFENDEGERRKYYEVVANQLIFPPSKGNGKNSEKKDNEKKKEEDEEIDDIYIYDEESSSDDLDDLDEEFGLGDNDGTDKLDESSGEKSESSNEEDMELDDLDDIDDLID